MGGALEAVPVPSTTLQGTGPPPHDLRARLAWVYTLFFETSVFLIFYTNNLPFNVPYSIFPFLP